MNCAKLAEDIRRSMEVLDAYNKQQATTQTVDIKVGNIVIRVEVVR